MSNPVGEGRKTSIIRNIELRIQQSNVCVWCWSGGGGFRKLRGENRIKCWQAVGCLPLTPWHKTFATRCKMYHTQICF